jgi:excisionase family DNA binding protein
MSEEFNPSDWITTLEAAELTGYDAAHIRRLIRQGRVVGKKFGRDWWVNRDNIETYAESMKKLGPAKHDPWRTGARSKDNGLN